MAHRSGRKGPVPYRTLTPGFEAVYTGKKAALRGEKTEIITTLSSDGEGREIRKWPVVSWTFPGQDKDWDKEILLIHEMQSKLGELDEETRRIRAHIASLVPCDSGFPVTVDELLNAIGKGHLDEPSFRNGCWCPGMWWDLKTTQPAHVTSMSTISVLLNGILKGQGRMDFIRKYPEAGSFINRIYDWLGPVSRLKKYQKLMIRRILMTIDYFCEITDTQHTVKMSDTEAIQRMEKEAGSLFEAGGKGERLDKEIAEETGLPRIVPVWKPEYSEILKQVKNPEKRELYKTCCAIASGVYTLSDCHHDTFRFIEAWIHGIGTGRLQIPTRKAGTEKKRLGQLLFGYVLGLDKWLLQNPMQFLVLDLGHTDLGFDPKNEILRVYAYLGEERTRVKEWLAACLWHNLTYCPIGGNPPENSGGLIRHRKILKRAEKQGVTWRGWMDSMLRGR
jgi:hypothetical protein